MFFQNKDVKKRIQAWAMEQVDAPSKKSVAHVVSEYVDSLAKLKKSFIKAGRPPNKVFANTYKASCDEIDKVVGLIEANLSCKSGCSFCCKSEEINVSIEEIYMIAEMALKQPVHRQFTLISKFATSQNTRNIYRQGQGAPCVFLDDDTCSIYESRPLACRSYLSTDSKDCQSRLEQGGIGKEVVKVSAPVVPRVIETAFWETIKPSLKLYEINSVFRFIFRNEWAAEKLLNYELTDADLVEYLASDGAGTSASVFIPVSLIQ